MKFPIEPFGRHHDRDAFSCGNDELNVYFKERIRKDVEAGVTMAFVMADGPLVIGYYTLSSHSIKRVLLPGSTARKLPKYPAIPVTLMGRLAVDSGSRESGFENSCCSMVFSAVMQAAGKITSFAVVVDAKLLNFVDGTVLCTYRTAIKCS